MNRPSFQRIPLPFFILYFLWGLVILYSFTRRELNLTLYNTPLLQAFQDQAVQLGYFYRPLATLLFGILILLLFGVYFWIEKTKGIRSKHIFFCLVFLVVTGAFAYPMFSHDIFNYLFNAKMMIVYHANPHATTAIQFAADPWVRFMHNIHTPAPYGFDWTILSLLPVAAGLPRFTVSFLFTKLFISSFLILEAYLFYSIARIVMPKAAVKRLLLFALNPLILIETVIIGHNDSVMMAPLLAAVLLLYKKDSVKNKVFAFFIWIFSVSIKYATVVLAPFLLFRKRLDFFTWGGVALLLVPLTRPDQIHSWYFQWAIPLLLLSKKTWAVPLAVVISLAGLLRYLPYITVGNWDTPVPLWRWFLLILPLLTLVFPPVRRLFSSTRV